MGVLLLNVLILIRPTLPWHILTPLESKLLSQICIESLTGFWMSEMLSRIKRFPFIKESVSSSNYSRFGIGIRTDVYLLYGIYFPSFYKIFT